MWIPIEEKKPDTADYVLVTIKWAPNDYEVTEVDYMAWCYVALREEQEYVDQARNILDHIIAWMPLPEPYKEVT